MKFVLIESELINKCILYASDLHLSTEISPIHKPNNVQI